MSEFLLKYQHTGPYVHCRLFASPTAFHTYAFCGQFTVRDEELDSLRAAMSGVCFKEERSNADWVEESER